MYLMRTRRHSFRSGAYPEKEMRYPLVYQTDGGIPVLRYRAQVSTNRISGCRNPDEVYETVNAILERCVMATHRWEKGDLLFINNMTTLHDRLPYKGERKMVRVRFGDAHHTALTY